MICIASHDAGGAEILSSYVRQRKPDCCFVLAGPAIKIFERKLGPVQLSPLENALAASSNLLCGTSWQSDIEWRAIALARDLGKPSAAFLDHWVNYRERFMRDSKTHLPDEIWVGDRLARERAEALFPGRAIKLVDNPYFADLRSELASLKRGPALRHGGLRILYVCEPLREHALLEYGNERHWGYVEEDALRYFLTHLDALGAPVGHVVLRPHPSEKPDKYDWALREFGMPIVRGGGRSLFEEVVDADVVVGCESMAMVIGLLAQRRVVSCIPPGGRPCVLPQTEIESLQALVASADVGGTARTSAPVR
jgi:hypothetical protein